MSPLLTQPSPALFIVLDQTGPVRCQSITLQITQLSHFTIKWFILCKTGKIIFNDENISFSWKYNVNLIFHKITNTMIKPSSNIKPGKVPEPLFDLFEFLWNSIWRLAFLVLLIEISVQSLIQHWCWLVMALVPRETKQKSQIFEIWESSVFRLSTPTHNRPPGWTKLA